MSEEGPLSSEEMIRRAREGLSQPPPEQPESYTEEMLEAIEDESLEPLEEDSLELERGVSEPRPTATGPSMSRSRSRQRPSLESDPFERPAQGPQVIAVIAGIVTLLIGIAVFVATAASAP